MTKRKPWKPCTILSLLLLALGVKPSKAEIIIPGYTFLGTAGNYTNPSQWVSWTYNVSALVSGPETALLTFDIRNDAPPYSPDWTESWVYFREEADQFLVHFEASGGWDSSHWRDVRLQIGATLLRDQYGPYNDHPGIAEVGTAGQSSGGEAWTILGQTGFAASTYILARKRGRRELSVYSLRPLFHSAAAPVLR